MNILKNTMVVGVASLVMMSTFSSSLVSHAYAISASAHTALTPLETLRSQGNKLVDERITLLNNVKREIGTNATLAVSEKNTLSGIADQYIVSMNSEKAYINNPNATVKDLQYHINSIWTNNRIYLIVVPSLRLSMRGYAMQTKAHTSLSQADGYTARIQTGYTQGKDTAALYNLEVRVKDMVSQATTANSLSQEATAQAIALAPSSYVEDARVVDPIRQKIDTATKAIQQAVAQQSAIEQGLKALGL